jgi:hypothetical protein
VVLGRWGAPGESEAGGGGVENSKLRGGTGGCWEEDYNQRRGRRQMNKEEYAYRLNRCAPYKLLKTLLMRVHFRRTSHDKLSKCGTTALKQEHRQPTF